LSKKKNGLGDLAYPCTWQSTYTIKIVFLPLAPGIIIIIIIIIIRTLQ
jgi:hypothetical protein